MYILLFLLLLHSISHGMESDVSDHLKNQKVKRYKKICVICMEKLPKRWPKKIALQCDSTKNVHHDFCTSCIVQHVANNSRCPLCRSHISEGKKLSLYATQRLHVEGLTATSVKEILNEFEFEMNEAKETIIALNRQKQTLEDANKKLLKENQEFRRNCRPMEWISLLACAITVALASKFSAVDPSLWVPI